MADFATFHRLLREALSREQQKVKGDERQTVDIEVLNMRNQQAVLRSNSFVLNLEEPEEWIAVEHDAIFKPNFAFSITLTWICGLGPSVGERVNLMKRKAEQAGLQLIQVPLWEGQFVRRPQIRIPLVDSQWMRKALQSSLLCMLEMSPDLMIQKSGAAVVRIVENELFFQDNYIIQSEENQAVYERLLITAAAHEILWDIVRERCIVPG